MIPGFLDIPLISPEGSPTLRWAEQGGAQRQVLHFKEPKNSGVLRARTRTRGKNPIILDSCLMPPSPQ